MSSICELTIHELHKKLTSGEVSSVEATRDVLSRIEKVESKIHSYISIFSEEALRQAASADEFIKRKKEAGEPVPLLAGIPLAIKDNLLTKGQKTTAASRILNNFIAP